MEPTRPESSQNTSEDEEETRKPTKRTSRIPTFQSSLARKGPGYGAESAAAGQTKDKASFGAELSKPKPREKALPVPSVRIPGTLTDTYAFGDHVDPVTSFIDTTGHSASKEEPSDPVLEVPDQLQRPSIRFDQDQDQSDPDPDEDASSPADSQEVAGTDSEGEDDDITQETSSIPDDGDHDLTLKEEEDESFGVEECPGEPALLNQTELDLQNQANDSNLNTEEKCTVEEEKVKSVSTEAVKTEEALVDETSQQSAKIVLERNTQVSTDSTAGSKNVVESLPEKEEKRREAKQSRTPDSSSRKAEGSSFVVFCLLPTTLLLLGGFGQHIWLYGIPKSTSHLLAQLELHWLEGLWVSPECSSDCRFTLVESIPEGLTFPPDSPLLPSISQAWKDLLDKANASVDVAAFYVTLRDSDLGLTEPSAEEGRQVFSKLMQLQPRGVQLRLAVNSPQSYPMDAAELASTGAEVRPVDLQSATGGIIHTKLLVVDRRNMYIGSANMDWRSLTQVKEVGVSVENCSCLAQDAVRIFGIYWDIGDRTNGTLPPYWPGRLSALSSASRPLVVNVNGVPARVYLSSAPAPLSAQGRSDDLATILSVIADAQKFVYISVMEYLPMNLYSDPMSFWPPIDNAIREAACARGVQVNVMVSCWMHSPKPMFIFLESLKVLSQPPLDCKVRVKVFQVPSTTAQQEIPFARVNHAKYMVTDRVAYIGTSNWSEGYFTQTAGVGLVVNQTGSSAGQEHKTIQRQLQGVFERDWNSAFASDLSNDHVRLCGKHKA
ncbi:5'-3' exonuclease PLD3 isoform X2 [Engraulis encrasicolus]|uniref:5'-3' exonuclease PLD3 isoform X2 n=1 Tax=Engraulis encrasicolus TaxID=184585 RepID=UPI002FD0499C